MVLRKCFYIRLSAGRSPRVHEVNSGRDPSLFTATQLGISSFGSKLLRPITRPSRPQQILIHKMAISQRINQVGKDPYLLEFSELHKISAHA